MWLFFSWSFVYNKGFKSRYAEDFKNFSINFNIKELEEETALFENLRLKNEFFSNNKESFNNW